MTHHQDTKNYGTILESGQLEPKYARELLDMGNLICVCLGHGDLDKQGIMKLCREHDTEKDWTYRISEENLSANADKWDEKNNDFARVDGFLMMNPGSDVLYALLK